MAAVLDSSAVLALLWGEPGAEIVAASVQVARVSAVNLSEVVARLVDRGMAPAEARQAIRELELRVDVFDTELAIEAGLLRAATRAHGLSLGDRACLALAARLEAEALTADRAWSRADVGVDIHLIR